MRRKGLFKYDAVPEWQSRQQFRGAVEFFWVGGALMKKWLGKI